MSSDCYFCRILTDTGSYQRILVIISNTCLHENLPGENGSDTWMDRQRKTTNILVISSNCLANAPDNSTAFNTEPSRSNIITF